MRNGKSWQWPALDSSCVLNLRTGHKTNQAIKTLCNSVTHCSPARIVEDVECRPGHHQRCAQAVRWRGADCDVCSKVTLSFMMLHVSHAFFIPRLRIFGYSFIMFHHVESIRYLLD